MICYKKIILLVLFLSTFVLGGYYPYDPNTVNYDPNDLMYGVHLCPTSDSRISLESMYVKLENPSIRFGHNARWADGSYTMIHFHDMKILWNTVKNIWGIERVLFSLYHYNGSTKKGEWVIKKQWRETWDFGGMLQFTVTLKSDNGLAMNIYKFVFTYMKI